MFCSTSSARIYGLRLIAFFLLMVLLLASCQTTGKKPQVMSLEDAKQVTASFVGNTRPYDLGWQAPPSPLIDYLAVISIGRCPCYAPERSATQLAH